ARGRRPAPAGAPVGAARSRRARRADRGVARLPRLLHRRPSAPRGANRMKIWIDMTAPAHVLVFRPIIRVFEERGHDVTVTARDYAQTLQLLELHRIPHTQFGRHGGASRARKAASLVGRTLHARRYARQRAFELAFAHGSNDLALAAASLGIPAVNMFDYEFAVQQHNIGCRLARRVMTPDRMPPERLARYGAGPEKLAQFPGLKEEYYLADFEPDP